MTLVKKNVAEQDFVISWRIRRNWIRNVLKREKQVSKLGHPHKISNAPLFISTIPRIPPFKLSYFENTIQNTRLLSKLIIFYLNLINSIQNSNILRLKFQFCHLSKSRDNHFNSQQNSKIYYTKISLSKINIPIFQFLKFLKP